MEIKNRVSKQIVITDQPSMNPNKITEVASLFSEDGEPFTPGGGGGYNDGQRLQIQTKIDALASGGGGDLLSIYASSLVDADANGLPTEDLTSDGVAFGDDFVITSSGGGNDKLWFRTPGLYVGQVNGTSTSDGDWLININGASLIAGSYNWVFRNLFGYGAPGTIVFDVGNIDVVKNIDGDLWEPGDTATTGLYLNFYAIQNGTAPAFMGADLAINRVA